LIRQKFNDGWAVSAGSEGMLEALQDKEGGKPKHVTLPHDAMIHEERTEKTKNGSQTGFYPGNLYTYTKNVEIPVEWEGKAITLEFEGVSNYARVYINKCYAGGHPNAYSNFYVSAEQFVQYGKMNEIKVEANNMEQSSRWYCGGGIYRNVNIMVGGPVRLQIDGLKITTPDVEEEYAAVIVKTELVNSGMINKKVTIQSDIIHENGGLVATDTVPLTAFSGESYISRQRMAVSVPLLWSDNTPNLYTCHVKVMDGDKLLDEEITTFGIRKLQLSAQTGLKVNGKVVKLRGTCIHHDNGIIGAATLERAEERRCEQLKAAGFNCIRSAHHPISKAMLLACDKIGMYVMDELTEIWNRPKNTNDYSMYFGYVWEKDIELLVNKDFNHPCVILYSMGNEILESGTAKGAELNRKINNRIKELDESRYTTNGINGLLVGMSHIGEIMAQISGMGKEKLAGSMVPSQREEKENEGGANKLNSMMEMLMGSMADALATSPILSELMDEFASGMDIAGYNYLTALHAAEKKFHPNRVVIGTETFPADIIRLWSIVKSNENVIGDMTWTGYDYLGEAGCGIFHYDGTQNFTSHWPERTAYIGDIDIIGYRRPISYLREIVYGLRKEPYIAVLRMNRNGQKSSTTPWMWKDNIASWTWPGYEGELASVDIYAKADEVELFLNGKSFGRKETGSKFVEIYEVPYEPGELTAVSYVAGVEYGKWSLETAGMDVELDVQVDRNLIKADGADLAYIAVGMKDRNGRRNLYAVKDITIAVEGEGSLQGYGNADPQAIGSYDDTTWKTYDGYVLAAIRSGIQIGDIKVLFQAEGCEPKTVIITVEENE